MKKRMPNVVYDATVDSWDFDWERIEKTLNEKTKLILINTPHNPTGKVVS